MARTVAFWGKSGFRSGLFSWELLKTQIRELQVWFTCSLSMMMICIQKTRSAPTTMVVKIFTELEF